MQKPYELDSSLSHQDWTPVVFHKKRDRPTSASPTISQLEPKHKRALGEDNPETFQQKSFDTEYIRTVVQKRMEKKLTQKQLATQIAVDVSIIQRFEQGKEVYDGALKHKLNRALNITHAKP